jgi:hypothetical protein
MREYVQWQVYKRLQQTVMQQNTAVTGVRTNSQDESLGECMLDQLLRTDHDDMSTCVHQFT